MIETHDSQSQHNLEVRNIHVHYYKICALKNVSFSLACTNFTALIGGNGAGKSTLMKAIVGIQPIEEGEILWRGSKISDYTNEIAYLPQKENIDWNFPLTVEGLVEMGRYPLVGHFSSFRMKDKDKVAEVMDLMEISHLKDRQISSLSGGQQQRAFIARALASEPHMLLLDEPFTGLDYTAQNSLASLLRNLVKQGTLIIASHHDLTNIEKIFDQVILLKNELISFGKPAEILTKENLEKAF